MLSWLQLHWPYLALIANSLPGLWTWHWLWHLGEIGPDDFPWAPEPEDQVTLYVEANHDWTGLA